MPRDFHNVRAWQLADDLAVAVYAATAGFPKHELYGLTQQVRRAVVSVASNIAEGCSRVSEVEYLRFCDIAHGSLAEVRYQLHLAHRLGYVSDEVFGALDEQAQGVGRTLHGLMGAIRKQSRSPQQ